MSLNDISRDKDNVSMCSVKNKKFCTYIIFTQLNTTRQCEVRAVVKAGYSDCSCVDKVDKISSLISFYKMKTHRQAWKTHTCA